VTQLPPQPAGGAASQEGPARPLAVSRLEVAGLQVGLGKSGPDVVSEVSFSVLAGELLGLVGESGSGKTTVALALLGHARRGLVIRAGQVRLDGTDLLRLGPRELRAARGAKVSYVPQDPSAALNPTLKVGTQLREALLVHPGAVDDPQARLAELMKEASLDGGADLLGRYPHQLSGGQQQRVALAMAFACRPGLIVLDEPTTGLDVTTQRHILDTVRTMCRAHGVAAVYVSHDLAVVSGLVSSVAVMYAGRIIESGPVARLFAAPLHPYTRGLIGAVPSPDRAEELAGIDGQQPRPGRRPAGCSFARRCAHAADACWSQQPEPVLVDGRLVRCLRVTQIAAGPPRRAAAAVTQAEAAPGMALSVRGLRASYGQQPVLADVSLDVPRTSCIAVVGESGSGKTTLARCIAGLHASWQGEISFGGAPLAASARRRPADLLRRIQYVFQNPYTSLNPRKTIGQIVAQPLEQFTRMPLRERSEQVIKVLEDVSLSGEFVTRYPDQLSGGERQRVAIARALVVQPDLLICDEVTSALDVSVQAIIVELLRGIQRDRQLTMIFITHNLALVRSIAQSAVVLRRGAVVESGPVREILQRPAHGYTRRLIEDVPRLVTGQVPAAGR
jgi:peptide/nickel transport system ATP-binding protein